MFLIRQPPPPSWSSFSVNSPLPSLLSIQGHMLREPQRTEWLSHPQNNGSTSFSQNAGLLHQQFWKRGSRRHPLWVMNWTWGLKYWRATQHMFTPSSLSFSFSHLPPSSYNITFILQSLPLTHPSICGCLQTWCAGTVSANLESWISRTLGPRELIFGTAIEVGVVYLPTRNE